MNVLLFLPSILGLVGALALAIHHYVIHKNVSDPKNEKAHSESCACACYLQPSDVSNHETWIIACLVLSCSWSLAIFTCPC